MQDLFSIDAQIDDLQAGLGQIRIECHVNKSIPPEIRYKTMLCVCDTFLKSMVKEAEGMGITLDSADCYEQFAEDMRSRLGQKAVTVVKIE